MKVRTGQTPNLLILSFGVFVFLFSIGCRTGKEPGGPEFKPSIAVFLDSTEASKAIIEDDVDQFFKHISKRDIEIQMKRVDPFKNRDSAVAEYQHFLGGQVSNWTAKEKIVIHQLLTEAKRLCDQHSPRIFPQGIRLIKIKTGHYGNDVFYTRGKNICIPENIFPMEDSTRYLPVIIHEVFHVLSRYNPALQNDLYKLIGFELSGKPIVASETLKEWMLTNPDAVQHKHFLKLSYGDSIYRIVPVIASKFNKFRPTQSAFFDYLSFDLYKLSEQTENFVILSNSMGKTIFPVEASPGFFNAIKDNTQYIIHPEEIMADNFMLALLAFDKNDYEKFSEQGTLLVNKVLSRLDSE